jgi:hypothetical protein
LDGGKARTDRRTPGWTEVRTFSATSYYLARDTWDDRGKDRPGSEGLKVDSILDREQDLVADATLNGVGL